MISYKLYLVLVITLLATVPQEAAAQTCWLLPTWISATPSRINFRVKTERCEGKVASAAVSLTGHGEEADIVSIEWKPDIPKPPFYSGYSWQPEMAIRPEASQAGMIDFYPTSQGKAFGALVIVYGYSQNAMNKGRRCIEDIYGKCALLKKQAYDEAVKRDLNFGAIEGAKSALKTQASEEVRIQEKRKAQAEENVQNLIAEKNRALKDIDMGLYCSECRRSATEIEKEDRTSFFKHLFEVKGRAIPGDPKVTAETIRKYDGMIDKAQAQARAAADKLDGIYAEYRLKMASLEAQKIRLLTDYRDGLTALKKEYDDARAQWAKILDDFNRYHRDLRWTLHVNIDAECIGDWESKE